jgi:uncharacterized membrane protein YhaH (DUF805 family)
LGNTVSFGEAIQTGFSKWVNFSDRASRSEYWYWGLFLLICAIGTQVVDHVTDIPIAHPIFLLVALLDLAISVRRLHDLDLSGWWVLLAVIPAGRIFLIAWFCLRGTVGANRFGDDPLAGVLNAQPAT